MVAQLHGIAQWWRGFMGVDSWWRGFMAVRLHGGGGFMVTLLHGGVSSLGHGVWRDFSAVLWQCGLMVAWLDSGVA